MFNLHSLLVNLSLLRLNSYFHMRPDYIILFSNSVKSPSVSIHLDVLYSLPHYCVLSIVVADLSIFKYFFSYRIVFNLMVRVSLFKKVCTTFLYMCVADNYLSSNSRTCSTIVVTANVRGLLVPGLLNISFI